MISISGYEVLEPAWEESEARIFRARRSADGARVLVKVPVTEHPSVQELSRLKREYDLTAVSPVKGVLKAYGLVAYRNGLALIQEDFGGVPVSQGLTGRGVDLGLLLRLGIQLADILATLHSRRIIHKDLHPGSILLEPRTGEMKLTRFGIASQLTAENQQPKSLHELEGSLAYMSPEQTGRMNRLVDYRTDFYSLGATLYELLTGAPVFHAADPLEWVHCHIAREPVPPHERNPAIPEAVSRLVVKLLAKAAEARYQSAQGLKADLVRCLEAHHATGSIELFPLGQHDASDQFRLPQKLYGRQAELDKLLESFQRASEGQPELVLLSGPSGVGKSSLVQELQRPVSDRRGYFAHGKFDPFQRNKPFSVIIDVFQELVHQLLTEQEDQIQAWRARLSGALRAIGAVLVDMVPELALFIGEQPPLPELPPLEAQNRFHLAIQSFVQVFTRPEHPLVLSLDDLQWADESSLSLLRLIATAPDSRALLIVGTYRDNEVGPSHPLMHMLEEIRQAGGTLHLLALRPLDGSMLRSLMADALYCGAERLAPLADFIEARTKGIPLFVNAFLKSLVSDGLLAFDMDQRQWTWNLAQIRARALAENVGDLFRDSVLKLTPLAREALRQAACIGNRFELHTLSLILELTPRATAHCLWEAISTGLLVPLDDAYRLFNLEGEQQTGTVNAQYQFAHDRVHQAAYELFPESERAANHWRLGRLLQRYLKPEEREQQLLAITNQFNQGLVLLERPEERYEIAGLNLAAGRRAKASSAYQPALDYLRTGIMLLGEEGWADQYELMLALHTEATEAAYLSTAFDETSRLAEVTLAHAQTLLARVKIHVSQVNALIAQNKQSEAVRMALWLLELLGVRFPKEPKPPHLLLALMRAKAALVGKRVEQLGQLRVCTEPTLLAVMRILQLSNAPAFLVLPKLFPLLALKQVELSVKHGNTAESSTGYAVYALLLCVLGDYEAGGRFGALALQLQKQLGSKVLIPRIWLPVHAGVQTWTRPIREQLEAIQYGYQTALEVGDFEFFAHLSNIYSLNTYYSGVALERLEATLAENSALLRKLKQQRAQQLHGLLQQVALNLKAEPSVAWILKGPRYDEEHLVPLHHQANDVNLLAHYHLNKLILAYHFRQHSLAREHAILAEPFLIGFKGGYFITVYVFYDALSALAAVAGADAKTRKRLLARAEAGLAKLRRWAALGPANQLHRTRLVEAERARILGDRGAAQAAYEEAISLAQPHQYFNEEALARELAGRFQLELGYQELAAHYLRGAHALYLRWGARAKERDLEASFPILLSPSVSEASRSALVVPYEQAAVLDHLTIMKASQAISGEIALEQLLEKMMGIVMENAGAQKGFLLLEQGQRFFIEAEATIDSASVQVLQSIPIDSYPGMAHSIVHYVARTKAPIVLQNASQESRFAADQYIIHYQPRSLLCIPLLNQGLITGILYLENNRTPGVFTPERVELLRLLSAQIAISIENARLYSGLELKVKERTAQLEQRNKDLQSALQHLKTTQTQLLQAEKMASLGQLTAGIAHEIKNPLNFINNFAQINQELVTELLAEFEAEGPAGKSPDNRRELLHDLEVNTEKIAGHGKRADAIIRSMLEHSRRTRGERRLTDLSRLIEDSVNLAYHGMRGQYPGFDVTIERDYDGAMDQLELIPEDIGRVVLNLCNNAFYAVREKASRNVGAYVPQVMIQTRDFQDRVEIRVRDNGPGIPEHDRQKIFEPFFTTKPAGGGTGLGLSLSYDIVQQGHGGALQLESVAEEGASFFIVLPKQQAGASIVRISESTA